MDLSLEMRDELNHNTEPRRTAMSRENAAQGLKDFLVTGPESRLAPFAKFLDGNEYMSHYSINRIENGMDFLRELFPEGKADELNFCLFSTSGIHGSYLTLEEISASWIQETDEWSREVTFLVIHPRLVRTSYGNAEPKTLADIEFLKKLRESSWAAVSQIGKERE